MRKKNVHGQTVTVNPIDVFQDPMIPVPGTYQGGIQVKSIDPVRFVSVKSIDPDDLLST